MRIIDNFFDDPGPVRRHALGSVWEDKKAFDGQTYKRVVATIVPDLHRSLERVVGPVVMLGQGYRLNYAGEPPNKAVHTDLGWGTHALVCYLSFGESGTALWKHKETGTTECDYRYLKEYERDADDPNLWDMVDLCHAKFNRAVVYESTKFHSRYPFEGYGDCPENGRLIAVAFFTPRS